MEFNLTFKTGNKKLQTKAIKFSESFMNWISGRKAFGTEAKDLISLFETIPDIYTVTDWTASTIANLPKKFVKPSGRESNNEDLRKLIESPNYYQSWKEFVKTYFYYYEILGNSFIYFIQPEGMQTISEMYLLPTDMTGVLLKYDNKLPNWSQEVVGYKVTINGVDYRLPYESVLHNRYPTLQYASGSYIWGMSKYIPGNKNANELAAIYDAKTSIISDRGAMGVLSNESEYPDSVISKDIQDRLATDYGLGSNQKKIIATNQRLTWQQISMNIQELQLIENNKLSFDKIIQLNGYDPVIFSTSGSTFSNKEQAETSAIKKVIKPKADDFYDNLNTYFYQYFKGDKVIVDWDKVAEMQPDYKALTDIYTRQIESGLITPLQAHKRIYGDPIDSQNLPPDEYFRKTSLTPVLLPEGQEGEINPVDEMPEITEEMIQELINSNSNGNGNGT
jgi:phage portal protein BeeE